jgi:hypothetical protein
LYNLSDRDEINDLSCKWEDNAIKQMLSSSEYMKWSKMIDGRIQMQVSPNTVSKSGFLKYG